jgi:hypothetical protein
VVLVFKFCDFPKRVPLRVVRVKLLLFELFCLAVVGFPRFVFCLAVVGFPRFVFCLAVVGFPRLFCLAVVGFPRLFCLAVVGFPRLFCLGVVGFPRLFCLGVVVVGFPRLFCLAVVGFPRLFCLAVVGFPRLFCLGVVVVGFPRLFCLAVVGFPRLFCLAVVGFPRLFWFSPVLAIVMPRLNALKFLFTIFLFAGVILLSIESNILSTFTNSSSVKCGKNLLTLLKNACAAFLVSDGPLFVNVRKFTSSLGLTGFVTLFTRGFLTKEGLVEGLSLMKTALRGGKDITMRVAGRIFNKTVSDKRNVRPNPRITNVTNTYNSVRNNE